MPKRKGPTEASRRRYVAEREKRKRWEAKLKPCPFCHGRAEFLEQEPPKLPKEITKGSRPMKCWLIKCRECGANRFCVTNHMQQLVAEWNHRRDETILAWVSEDDRIGLVRGTKMIVDRSGKPVKPGPDDPGHERAAEIVENLLQAADGGPEFSVDMWDASMLLAMLDDPAYCKTVREIADRNHDTNREATDDDGDEDAD